MDQQLISFVQHRLLTGDTRSLSRRYASGELIRLRRGIYYPADAWLAHRPWERYKLSITSLAMVLPGLAFCYESAVSAWGLPLLDVPRDMHLAVSGKAVKRCSASRVQVHPDSDIAHLVQDDAYGFGERHHRVHGRITEHEGFNLTEQAPTVIATALRLGFAGAIVLVDGARQTIGREGTGPRVADAELMEAIEVLPSMAKRERARELMHFSTSQSESAGESLSRANMHILGFEPPELQHALVDAGGVYGRGDFFWPGINTVGEFDGRAKYSDLQLTQGRSEGDLRRLEKERDGRIQRSGQRVVHWEWADAINLARFERMLDAYGIPRRDPRLPGRSGG